MNRKLKSAINKFCYKLGLKHYEKIRNSMVIKANALAKEGKPDDEILESLGIPTYEGNKRTSLYQDIKIVRYASK